MDPTLDQWERAEKARSAYDAAQIYDPDALASPRNVARYFPPPSDTVHPLEYAFHLLGDVRGKATMGRTRFCWPIAARTSFPSISHPSSSALLAPDYACTASTQVPASSSARPTTYPCRTTRSTSCLGPQSCTTCWHSRPEK